MNVVRNIEATCASALPTHSRSSWGPRESFANIALAKGDYQLKTT